MIPDVSVVIVSHNHARWLARCLTSLFAHIGAIGLETIVVDSDSADDTAEVVRRFPQVKLVRCANHGFGHANNRGYEVSTGRYVLFLNPDTEFLTGRVSDLVELLDRRTEIGIAGVHQLAEDGATTQWTIRYFPDSLRAWGEALGSERWPIWARRFRERELDPHRYLRCTRCDWTVGSFAFVRRQVLEQAGRFDERFFLYLEETDLCLRARQAGWLTVHVPSVAIKHDLHSGEAGLEGRQALQAILSRVIYAHLHFSPTRRIAYLSGVLFGVLRRAATGQAAAGDLRAHLRYVRRAFRTVLGVEPAPFEPVPPGPSRADRAPEAELLNP